VAELAAAITAGGRVVGPFAERIGSEIKALAPFGGRLLIDVAIAAARDAGATRISVVGPSPVLAHCAGAIDEGFDETPTGEGNLRCALEAARDDALLFLTSDMPFVDGTTLAEFLARCDGADVAMPLAEAPDYEAAYPDAPAHLTSIGSERVAGGSAFFIGPGAAPRIVDVATRLFAARKSAWAMAVLLGPGLLARYALRRLRVVDIERRAERVLGLRACGIRQASPALCYDIDTLEEYDYALERLARG
jgi:molybdopterin-guanine dinucleotide biosynthesis protein A